MENRGPAFATTAPSGTELSAVVTSGVAWVPSALNAPHIAFAAVTAMQRRSFGHGRGTWLCSMSRIIWSN